MNWPHAALILFVILLSRMTHAADEQPMTIALPSQSELSKLAELTAQITGVSLQYNPQRLQGTVKLSIQDKLTPAQEWDVFNQVLVSQGFTTVVSGSPPVYQVVQLQEAAAISMTLTTEQQAKLKYPPGYSIVVQDLTNIAPDTAVKTIGALFTGQNSQIRTLGPDAKRIIIAGVTANIRAAQSILAMIDRPGMTPEVRLLKPQRASLQTLQSSATAAWTAVTRIASQPRPVEIQLTPDGQQLLLIAASDDIADLVKLVENLDKIEPLETRTYRPKFFAIEDVASLLGQVLRGDRTGQSELPIIRDKLTNSLIIKATTAEHQRIEDLIRKLDEAPEASRRQVRNFVVKNRQVDELAGVLAGLITSGAVEATLTQTASAPSPAPLPSGQPPVQGTPPVASVAAGSPAPLAPPADAPAVVASAPGAGKSPEGSGGKSSSGNASTTSGGTAAGVLLTTDPSTNRIIAFGDSRQLDQVGDIIKQLDLRQPQVEIEVIMTTLSDSENLNLGVELAKFFQRGQVSTTVTSLFGLSSAVAGDPVARSLGATTGFGGLVVSPGDFAGVIQALETVTSGTSLIRSRVVVKNNAKATVNGVVQQPISSINTGNTVATTSFGGTSDAGTQLNISPQISAADYVTLTYQVSQSAFIGSPTVTSGGAAIPPPKRSDSISSVATIPDGYVIALGGLSNISKTDSESRLPLLGQIPGLGNLFKSQSHGNSRSKFYIFIRVNVMRDEEFRDLRWASGAASRESGITDPSQPTLEPRLIK